MLSAATTVALHTLIAGMFRASLSAPLYQAAVGLLESGTSLADLADQLAQTEYFAQVYATTDTAVLADTLAAGLLGVPPNEDFSATANTAFRLARDGVAQQLAAGIAPGRVIHDAIVALAGTTADAFQDGRQRLENQAQVAHYYVACGGSATTLAEWQAVLAGVSADSRSVHQALAAIDLSLGTATTLAAFPGRFSLSSTLSVHELMEVPVALLAGHTYVIQASATPASLLDPEIVSVRGADGQVIAAASNNDYAGWAAQLSLTPTTDGIYTITLGGEGSTAGGISATLRDVTVTSGQVQWYDLALSVPVVAMIDAPFARHEYAVSLAAGDVVVLSLASQLTAADPLARPKLFEIRDPDGQIVADASAVASKFSAALLRLTATSAGTYKISVGDGYNDMGVYRLEATPVTAGAQTAIPVGAAAGQPVFAADLPDNTHTTGYIAPGADLTGRIDSAGDVDWVRVSLSAGHHYTFHLQGAPSDKGTLRDAYIDGIYTAQSERLPGTADDDSATGHDAKIAFIAPLAGDYYLALRGYSRQTGTYSVSVTDHGAIQLGAEIGLGGTTPATLNEWTIMVYLAADNDLEPFALLDLNEMEAASLPVGVNLAVLLDRIPGYDASDGNWTDARQGIIAHDNHSSLITSNLASIGEPNMGAAATLTTFIDWAVQEQPAQHYALVVWNHGDGVNGVAFDESSGNAALTIHEIQGAIAASLPGRVDLVGFDACSMATLELADALGGVADYLVASQDLEPGEGWNYTTWLTAAYAHGARVDAETVAVTLVDSFGTQYADQGDVTLAALDLRAIDATSSALQAFVNASTSAGTSDWQAIQSAYRQSIYFDDASSVDILDFAATLSTQQGVSSALAAAAAGLTVAVASVVIATTANMPAANGLSIYWPAYRPYDFADSYTEDTIPLLGRVDWDGFLQNYWDQV